MQKIYILKTATIFICLVAVILSIISGVGYAFAADNFSNVLNDLYADSNFNTALYPEKLGDYSLNVIQIAESTDNELLIYVYQPSAQAKDLRASSINISRYADNATETSFKNYRLEFCNSYGTLYKYKVTGFELLNTAQRVYNVLNILRPFDKLIDKTPTGGNTASEVPNAVGQCWTATTENGNVTYSMKYSEVVGIKNKHVGYINYDDGANIGWTITAGTTSAHFVAFSTDKPMDKLKSASITFNERDVQYKYCCNPIHLAHGFKTTFDYKYSEPTVHEPNPLTLRYTEKASNASGGYVWNRIQKTTDFLKDKNDNDITLTNQAEGELAKTQWVLNFYETPVLVRSNDVWVNLIVPIASLFTGDADVKKTEVSDVMILELEFEYQGKTYKLGAVDNKQTGSLTPDGSTNDDNFDFWQWVWNCVCKLFTGTASTVETIVAVVALFVAFVLFVCAFSFIKWVYRKLFR